jgi:hypothetical protein
VVCIIVVSTSEKFIVCRMPLEGSFLCGAVDTSLFAKKEHVFSQRAALTFHTVPGGHMHNALSV